jgi:glutaminyl-tRNA synthetase
MYDFAHPLSDAFEGTTHSICTLEFEDHRPLYDWVLDELASFLPTRGAKSRPRQIEFAKLVVETLVTSKRKLKELVGLGLVAGWDDPRLATLAGMRRRGVPPAAIRAFCGRGASKSEGVVELAQLEHAIREELDRTTSRAMCVLKPLLLTIVDWPEGEERTIAAARHPTDASMGTRSIPFGRQIYIEQTDFMLEPPKKFFRLAKDREVRLRWGPIVKCVEVVLGPGGEPVELRCTHDPASLSADGGGRKVKGTIHWVSRARGVRAEVRLYDRLFTVANPSADPEVDYKTFLNPASLEVVDGAIVEPALATAAAGERFQFERTGYFTVDPDSRPGALVFNRTVGLRDSWAKVEPKGD